MKQNLRSFITVATTALLAFSQLVAGPAAHAATVVPVQISTKDLTDPTLSASLLAQNLMGTGVTVSNASYTGANAQLGTVKIADPALVSFNDGVIMSSGYVKDVVGPNTSESTTGDMASQPGMNSGAADPDLTQLIANSATVNPMTFDSASLSFDFVPTASTVYFTYVFGSEEYLEWVNLYNDVFAFYITDAAGHTTNCALTPQSTDPLGSNQPVSIDSINSNVNPSMYRDNGFWNPPANPLNIQSDGLTVELICQAAVTAGQTNHIKLAIADTSDQILDTVVMIKSHSLSTVKPESCNNGIDDNNGDPRVDMEDPYCVNSTTPLPANVPAGTLNTTVVPTSSFSTAPPFAGNEGDMILLDGNALGLKPLSSSTVSTWNVYLKSNKSITCNVVDANYNQVSSGQPFISTSGGYIYNQAFAICPQDGEYIAYLHQWEFASDIGVNGDNGGTDLDFWVHNAAPVIGDIAPAMDQPLNASDAVNVYAQVSDPGGDAFTCKIAWGDGTYSTGILPDVNGYCSDSHTYGVNGDFLISFSATDSQGAASAQPTLVHLTGGLTKQTVSVSPALPALVNYGDSFTVLATSTSGNTLTFNSLGGCNNVDNVFTVTSATSDCTVLISAAGDTTYATGNFQGTVKTATRPITVTAAAKSKVYGDADPALTFTTSTGGVVQGDTIYGALARNAGENLGNYVITQGTVNNLNNPNYSITYVSANLTITGVAPVVTTNPSSVSLAAGAVATFTSAATGKPAPTVKWQVAPSGSTSFTDIVGATSTSYSFTTAATDNGKQYRAVFSNGVSPSANTTAATLTIAGVPTVTSLSSTSAAVGTGITITGTNLGTTSSVVFATGKTAKFIVLSATQVLTSVPTGTVTGQITVTTAGGTAKSGTFTIKTGSTLPTVTAYSLSAARPGSANTVTLTGTNLVGITSATLNGVVLSYAAISATSASVVVPATGVTSGPIKVVTDGGTSANTIVFTVAVQPVALASGANHSCALLSDSTVKCWGLNTNGQLGNGTTTQSTSPVVVPNLSGVASIAAGGSTTCALLSTGAVKCWGLNTNGQLGDNTTVQKLVPTAVSGIDGTAAKATAIAVGTSHSCALITDGTVRCWGLNTSGQLGDNTLVQKLVPTTVKATATTNLTGVTVISAGAAHTCAIVGSGATATAKCWGSNANGRLGNASTTNSSLPVAVTVTLTTGLTAIVAGGSHTLALVPSVTLAPRAGAAWGLNTNGQVGDGTTTQRTSPVALALL